MARPRRAEQTIDLRQAIKDAAWQQIEQEGPAAVSLRGIGRALGIAAPSIYHYYPTRDHLLTVLAEDALRSLADAQRQASVSARKPEQRLVALGLSYRDWAIQHPQKYLLIFGSPVPNYERSGESGLSAAHWALLPLIETLQALHRAGKLQAGRLSRPSAALKSMLAAWRKDVQERAGDVEGEVLYLSYVIWARVHGLVSLELGGQAGGYITAAAEVFRREIESILLQYS